MPLSAEELLTIARSYWRPDKDYDARVERSPETERLQARWEQALRQHDRWLALLEGLRQELPGFTVGDATATCFASFRCAAYPEEGTLVPRFRWVLVGCLSILAPVSTTYGVRYEYSGKLLVGEKVFFDMLPAELQGAAGLMGQRIMDSFGASPLPGDVAQTPIPLFVDPLEPPDTTLFHALFTSQPERVP